MTQSVESVHGRLRKLIKTRAQFPSDDASTKGFAIAGGDQLTKRDCIAVDYASRTVSFATTSQCGNTLFLWS